MHAADVVCLTSRHEALPMVVLEAMAVGRPVVATRVGGVADVVQDGRTGLLFAVGDTDGLAAHLSTLASDRELAAAMGEAGRARQGSLYGADRMVSAYAVLLHGAAVGAARSMRTRTAE
jgi:glycosyltransferase involved in cell wall biosynthesis